MSAKEGHRRVSQACWLCKERKQRCDDGRPCSRCHEKNIECTDSAPPEGSPLWEMLFRAPRHTARARGSKRAKAKASTAKNSVSGDSSGGDGVPPAPPEVKTSPASGRKRGGTPLNGTATRPVTRRRIQQAQAQAQETDAFASNPDSLAAYGAGYNANVIPPPSAENLNLAVPFPPPASEKPVSFSFDPAQNLGPMLTNAVPTFHSSIMTMQHLIQQQPSMQGLMQASMQQVVQQSVPMQQTMPASHLMATPQLMAAPHLTTQQSIAAQQSIAHQQAALTQQSMASLQLMQTPQATAAALNMTQGDFSQASSLISAQQQALASSAAASSAATAAALQQVASLVHADQRPLTSAPPDGSAAASQTMPMMQAVNSGTVATPLVTFGAVPTASNASGNDFALNEMASAGSFMTAPAATVATTSAIFPQATTSTESDPNARSVMPATAFVHGPTSVDQTAFSSGATPELSGGNLIHVASFMSEQRAMLAPGVGNPFETVAAATLPATVTVTGTAPVSASFDTSAVLSQLPVSLAGGTQTQPGVYPADATDAALLSATLVPGIDITALLTPGLDPRNDVASSAGSGSTPASVSTPDHASAAALDAMISWSSGAHSNDKSARDKVTMQDQLFTRNDGRVKFEEGFSQFDDGPSKQEDGPVKSEVQPVKMDDGPAGPSSDTNASFEGGTQPQVQSLHASTSQGGESHSNDDPNIVIGHA